ncbi:MAG: GatB/YqeY domain-containing protein [Candidatus Omnitrophota bacterium]|jgi:hypothetical protein
MLKDTIENNLKNALKNRDAAVVSTLRFLKSAMQNLSIEKRKELEDEDVISVIKRQIKQRRDSIEGFRQGKRMDLVHKEQSEIDTLSAYLPKAMSREEVLLLVRESMFEIKAVSIKDMGNVIKRVISKSKGAADASIISAIAKEELSKAC